MDAIVRPQLTITQSLSLLVIKQCCLYATGKVLEKFRGWVSGPPPSDPVPVLPPPVTLARMHGMGGDKAGANANHYHLGRPQGAGKRGRQGQLSFKPVQNGTVKPETQRKAL